jgi:hypothetical protein
MVADVMPISIAAGFIVAAGIAIDIVAVWQWRQGSKETSVARLRSTSHRARSLAVVIPFLCFALPVASVLYTFDSVDSVVQEHRAQMLAEGISAAMNTALLGAIFAIPPVAVAVLLAKRIRTAADRRPNA